MPLPRDAKAAMEQVASVIRPVSITMLFVVYCMVALCNPYSFSRASCRDSTGSALRFYMVYKENDADSTGEKLTGAITNAAAMVGMMVVITFMMFFCYKYRCTKLIWAYLVFSVGGLLAIFGSMWLTQVIEKYGIVMDWITLVVGIFNWSAIGVMSVFWMPPSKLSQFYLVFISSMMAWILAWMPPWTGWAILIALALYDIAAVLCPGGPLRLLVEEAQDRNERIPALVYETTMTNDDRRELQQQLLAEQRQQQQQASSGPPVPGQPGQPATTYGAINEEVNLGDRVRGGDGADGAALASPLLDSSALLDAQEPEAECESVEGSASLTEGSSSSSSSEDEMPILHRDRENPSAVQAPQTLQQQQEAFDDDEGALKLGLGDFVFYSVLVGKGSAYGVATVTASFVAILMGLCLTLMVLAVAEKALPALPFSIFLGVFFVFVTNEWTMPFVMPMATEGPIFV